MNDKREVKRFSFPVKIVDEEKGIVEHFFSVFGNEDLVGDIVHPGSFTKTLSERGGKVRVLDMHNRQSVMDVLGMPVQISEVDKSALPDYVLKEYPDASGGAKATTQFLLDTPEGAGAFARIKAGAIDEWSFGFDVIKKDFSKNADGNPVRNIREVRLWEYGPVIFGANPATTTVSAKTFGGGKDLEHFYNADEKRAMTLEEVAFERTFKGQFYDGFWELMNLLDIATYKTINDDDISPSDKEIFLLQAIEDFSGLASEFIVALFKTLPSLSEATTKLSEVEIEILPDTPDPTDESISDAEKQANLKRLLLSLEIERSKNQNIEV